MYFVAFGNFGLGCAPIACLHTPIPFPSAFPCSKLNQEVTEITTGKAAMRFPAKSCKSRKHLSVGGYLKSTRTLRLLRLTYHISNLKTKQKTLQQRFF